MNILNNNTSLAYVIMNKQSLNSNNLNKFV